MLASAPYVLVTGAVLPVHAPVGHRLIVGAACLLLCACGLTCLRVPHRIPAAAWAAAPFAAVAVITGLNLLTSDASTGAQLFYLWPALYAAMHLSRGGLCGVLAAVFAGEAATVFVIFHDIGRAWADWTAMVLALSMSSIVAMTLRERANRLLRALEDQALADPLTGLSNRRHFDRELAHTNQWLRHGGGPLALLSIDLDRFKAVNDTWGHAAGDLALQAVASALRAVIEDDDVAARLGGDEFVVLSRRDRQSALRLAGALREAIAATTGVPGGPPGVSIGVAVSPDDGGTVEALLAASDTALYEAKITGRGRVTAAGAPAGPPGEDRAAATPAAAPR
jgi:diguanylate cyclase (GGDEF)-like protein